jgi:hypothetical protein
VWTIKQRRGCQVFILDGEGGELILNPTADTLKRYRTREEQAEKREDVFLVDRHEPAVTLCGRTICVGANAEFLEEAELIKDSGAEEVGLFRTEFLHLESPNASEDTLAESYGSVVKALAPRVSSFAPSISAVTRWTSVWCRSLSQIPSSAGAASACLWDESIFLNGNSAPCCGPRCTDAWASCFQWFPGSKRS